MVQKVALVLHVLRVDPERWIIACVVFHTFSMTPHGFPPGCPVSSHLTETCQWMLDW